MPKQVIPIEGISEAGLNKDSPSVSLSPNTFSDARNVRFDDGAIRKMLGHEVILSIPGVKWINIQHVAYWENPNKDVWVVIDRELDSDVIYLVYFDDTNTLIRSQRYATTDRTGDWQSTVFNGGYTFVANNGNQAPVYLSDQLGTTITTGNFAPLPNWESYDVSAANSQTDTDETNIRVTAKIIVSFGNLLMAGGLRETRADNTVIRDLAGVVRSSSVAVLGDIPQNWNPFATGAGTADELLLADTGTITAMRELQGKMSVYTNDSIHQVDVTNQGMRTIPITSQYGALSQDAVFEFDGRHLVVGSNDIYIFSGHPGSIQSISDSKVRRYFYDNLSPIASDNLYILRNQEYDEIWVCYPTLASSFGGCDEALIFNFRTNLWTTRDLPQTFSGTLGPLPGGGAPNASITFSPSYARSGNNAKMNAGRQEVQTMTIDGDVRAPHSGLGQIQAFDLPEMDRNRNIGTITAASKDATNTVFTGIPIANAPLGSTFEIRNHPQDDWNGTYTVEARIAPNQVNALHDSSGYPDWSGSSTAWAEGFSAAGREEIELKITGDSGPNTRAAVYTITADDTDGADINNTVHLFTYNGATVNGGCLLTVTDNLGTHRFPANALSGFSDGDLISTSTFFSAVADYIDSDFLPDFTWTAVASSNTITFTSELVGAREITAATMREFQGTTVGITGTQAATNDANNLTLVRTTADPLAATSVSSNGSDATVAGIDVTVAPNGTYTTVGALTETTPPITGTGSGIYTVTANTSYIIYTGFVNGTLTWNGTGQSGSTNIEGENFSVGFRGPAWQTGDGGLTAATGELGTGTFSVGVSGHGSVTDGSLGERTVTTNTRQRITFTNNNPFAVDLLTGSTGGARTLAASGGSFHVQNNNTTNTSWTVTSAYINDTGTGSGYAGGFGVAVTNDGTFDVFGNLSVASGTGVPNSLSSPSSILVNASTSWVYLRYSTIGASLSWSRSDGSSGNGGAVAARGPNWQTGDTIPGHTAAEAAALPQLPSGGRVTVAWTGAGVSFQQAQRGTRTVTTNTRRSISFTNNNNVTTSLSVASTNEGEFTYTSGQTRDVQDGDTSSNAWTIAFEATERSTWTATNNRTIADHHVQREVFGYMLTVDGNTYDLGDIVVGGTASTIVVGTTSTATYSARINGTGTQTIAEQDVAVTTTGFGGSSINITRGEAEFIGGSGVDGTGDAANTAGITVSVTADGTYDIFGALNVANPAVLGTGITVNANTAIIALGYQHPDADGGSSNATYRLNVGGTTVIVNSEDNTGNGAYIRNGYYRGPAYQAGDENDSRFVAGIGILRGTLTTGTTITRISGGDANRIRPQTASRTITTNTRRRITYQNSNTFPITLSGASNPGAGTVLGAGTTTAVQTGNTTNQAWTIRSNIVNDTGTGSGYAGGFTVNHTDATVASNATITSGTANPGTGNGGMLIDGNWNNSATRLAFGANTVVNQTINWSWAWTGITWMWLQAQAEWRIQNTGQATFTIGGQTYRNDVGRWQQGSGQAFYHNETGVAGVWDSNFPRLFWSETAGTGLNVQFNGANAPEYNGPGAPSLPTGNSQALLNNQSAQNYPVFGDSLLSVANDYNFPASPIDGQIFNVPARTDSGTIRIHGTTGNAGSTIRMFFGNVISNSSRTGWSPANIGTVAGTAPADTITFRNNNDQTITLAPSSTNRSGLLTYNANQTRTVQAAADRLDNNTWDIDFSATTVYDWTAERTGLAPAQITYDGTTFLFPLQNTDYDIAQNVTRLEDVSGEFTTVSAEDTDLTAPVITQDTEGVGRYGATQEQSPAIGMRFQHDSDGGPEYFLKRIPDFPKNITDQDTLTRHVYDYLITQVEFQGIDPSIDTNVQDTDAIYYTTYDEDSDKIIMERVTTGPQVDNILALSYFTEFDGIVGEETEFGGDVSSFVEVSVTGQTGQTPPVVRVADPSAGNFDIVLGHNQTPTIAATTIRDALHGSTAFTGSGSGATVRLTREAVGPNTNVAIMSKQEDVDNVLPTTYGGTFVQERAGFDPQVAPATMLIQLPISQFSNSSKATTIDLTGPDDTIINDSEIAIQVAAGINAIPNAQWSAVANDSEVIITSDSEQNYYRWDNGLGDSDAYDGDVRWNWTVFGLERGLAPDSDAISETGRAVETTSGVRVRYSQPTWFRVQYSDGTSQDYLYGGNYQGALADNAMYHGDIYRRPDNYEDTDIDFHTRRDIDFINLDMRDEITIYGQRRLNLMSNTTSNTLSVFPTQYGEHAFYFTQFDVLDPGTLAPDTDSDALPATIPNPSLFLIDTDADTEMFVTSVVEVDYDPFRPWPKIEVNKAKNFVIMADETNLYGMDLTYGFNDSDIVSYIERTRMHLQPSKDVEMMAGIYLDVEGDSDQTFNIRVKEANNATTGIDLSTDTGNATYPYTIGGTEADYKADIRVTGRMVSYRIENVGKKRWDIGGISIEVGKGGTR